MFKNNFVLFIKNYFLINLLNKPPILPAGAGFLVAFLTGAKDLVPFTEAFLTEVTAFVPFADFLTEAKGLGAFVAFLIEAMDFSPFVDVFFIYSISPSFNSVYN
jgi:hypothetical protein